MLEQKMCLGLVLDKNFNFIINLQIACCAASADVINIIIAKLMQYKKKMELGTYLLTVAEAKLGLAGCAVAWLCGDCFSVGSFVTLL